MKKNSFYFILAIVIILVLYAIVNSYIKEKEITESFIKEYQKSFEYKMDIQSKNLNRQCPMEIADGIILKSVDFSFDRKTYNGKVIYVAEYINPKVINRDSDYVKYILIESLINNKGLKDCFDNEIYFQYIYLYKNDTINNILITSDDYGLERNVNVSFDLDTTIKSDVMNKSWKNLIIQNVGSISYPPSLSKDGIYFPPGFFKNDSRVSDIQTKGINHWKLDSKLGNDFVFIQNAVIPIDKLDKFPTLKDTGISKHLLKSIERTQMIKEGSNFIKIENITNRVGKVNGLTFVEISYSGNYDKDSKFKTKVKKYIFFNKYSCCNLYFSYSQENEVEFEKNIIMMLKSFKIDSINK